jgi:uncharacterized protein YutE (UPF0331/DUF86 family)
MNDDIIINKSETIRRCLQRVQEVYQDDPENLNDFIKQDSIILNIQRACEASIDLAMHVTAEKGFEVPQNSRDVFQIIERNRLISPDLSAKLQAMVGFRNIAVHDYQSIHLGILQKIIENHLKDLLVFADIIGRI